ncbi:MAG: hypothetical protein ACLSD2_00560 [Clostridia bacterium]
MNELRIIDVMNEAMLKVLKEKNADYEKNLMIKNLLKDEAVFFKIDKSKAYEILKNVGVKQEQLENVYKKLISSDVFYDLLNRKIIKKDDKNILIKYTIYRL